MGANRRDFLILGAGAAAGTVFTPVPWKLLDDASIWTQNWSWTPRPPRGEVKVRYTACTLCGEGCGVRARCVAEHPVGMAGVKGHPLSDGTLCPYGFGAHQMPYHPARVRQWNQEQTVASVAAQIKAAGGAAAIIDEAPGRADSEAYRRYAAALGIGYVVVRPAATATLAAVAKIASVPAESLGFDLENTRTVLSFGAPVLENWTTPGRVARLWRERKFRLVYAGSDLTPTASLADRYVRIRPGAEGAAAIAIGRALVDAGGGSDRADIATIFANVPFERASSAAGLQPGEVRDLAAELAHGVPVIAVSGGGLPDADEQAIALLNALLGSAGAPGGIVRRVVPWSEPAADLASIPDRSLKLAIVDHGFAGGVLPWTTLERKLEPNARVVSISPYRAGVALRAAYTVASPAWLEAVADAATPAGSATASYTIAPALLAHPAADSLDGPAFLARVCETLGVACSVTREAAMHQRVEAIHNARKGVVFSFAAGTTRPVKEYESADKLWTAFAEGACWTDDASPAPEPLRVRAPEVLVLAATMRTAAIPDAVSASREVPAVVPPLASKLDRESTLYRREDRVYLHPSDAASLGLGNGDRVRVECAGTSLLLGAAIDPNVSPGTAALAHRSLAQGQAFVAAQISRV